jgi:plastocyanin
MRRLLATTVTAVLLAACGGDNVTDPPETPTVTMLPNSFIPFTTTIVVGGSVVFEFPADPHNVIFARLTGAPADIPATTSESVSRRFDLPGTFPFECRLHPGMEGEVVVNPRPIS